MQGKVREFVFTSFDEVLLLTTLQTIELISLLTIR